MLARMRRARLARSLAPLLAFLAALAGPGPAQAADATLRFEREGALVRSLSRAQLTTLCGVQRVAIEDPYYPARKQYLAFPLACVLEQGFGKPVSAQRDQNFFLRALDGYVKPVSGARLAEPGGWLAFADAELTRGDDPQWAPIDRRQVDPGPFYLVWSGAGQADAHRYPWPYQLAAIEIAPFEARYPHTLPAGLPREAPAWTGFAVFRSECVACHAINGEGGTIGPELNLPLSIVEYRPADQLKRFIHDPAAFRYTSMPANPHLTPAQLDGLIAYFTAMRERKHDPRGASPAP
jgi:mono/diheme cytochrome c family protein